MNFRGIPPGTSRTRGLAELGLPHMLHPWLPWGCCFTWGYPMPHGAMEGMFGTGGAMWSCHRLVQGMKRVSSHLAVSYLTKGN